MKKIITVLFFLTYILEAKNLKIMTYNIYGGRLANGTTIGRNIKKFDPDFISLQEVDYYTKRSNFNDIVKDIAQELNYSYYYFKKSRDYDSGEFGIGFVSRYPIEKIFEYELPSIGAEKRQVIAAQIDEKIFSKKVLIIDTHLDYNPNIKPKEMEALLNITAEFPGDVKFLTGDFNLLPTTEYYQQIIKEWNDTYLFDEPRIDYIFGDKTDNWSLRSSKFIKDEYLDWSTLSDHFPYMINVDIK